MEEGQLACWTTRLPLPAEALDLVVPVELNVRRCPFLERGALGIFGAFDGARNSIGITKAPKMPRLTMVGGAFAGAPSAATTPSPPRILAFADSTPRRVRARRSCLSVIPSALAAFWISATGRGPVASSWRSSSSASSVPDSVFLVGLAAEQVVRPPPTRRSGHPRGHDLLAGPPVTGPSRCGRPRRRDRGEVRRRHRQHPLVAAVAVGVVGVVAEHQPAPHDLGERGGAFVAQQRVGGRPLLRWKTTSTAQPWSRAIWFSAATAWRTGCDLCESTLPSMNSISGSITTSAAPFSGDPPPELGGVLRSPERHRLVLGGPSGTSTPGRGRRRLPSAAA